MKVGKSLGLFALLAAFVAGCAAESSVEEKLKRADAYLSEHTTEPGYRAVAHQLYGEVLEQATKKEHKVRAHFGIGMIGLIDLVQGIPELIGGLTGGSDDGEPSTLPPAADLTATIDTLLHQVLGKGIAEHFGEVLADDNEFEFKFTGFAFEPTEPSKQTVDLNGIWDRTEIGLVYGLIQVVLGLEEFVFAYNDVVETAIGALLAGGEIPDFPEDLTELPDWITEVAVALELDPLPWLTPEFGVLSGDNPMAVLIPIQNRLIDGFSALKNAMDHLAGEEAAEQEGHVFPKLKYFENVLGKLLPDVALAKTAGGFIDTFATPVEFKELFASLESSTKVDTSIFVAPDWVWSLLDNLLSLLQPAGSTDPVALGVPGLNLSKLFGETSHIADLKALLPAFKPDGKFVFEVETADQAHTVPTGLHEIFADIEGRVDAANGVVDPLYLFFADASVNGLLVPMKTVVGSGSSPSYAADTDNDYSNGHLMRLITNLSDIIGGLL